MNHDILDVALAAGGGMADAKGGTSHDVPVRFDRRKKPRSRILYRIQEHLGRHLDLWIQLFHQPQQIFRLPGRQCM